MRSHFGREIYEIEDENGRIEPQPLSFSTVSMTTDAGAPAGSYRFGRMFADLIGEEPARDSDAYKRLIALGEALNSRNESAAPQPPSIPAGYTYLGQFISHDMTFDPMAAPPRRTINVANLRLNQRRTPQLDLDSLYGSDDPESKELYESDEVTLKCGQTTGNEEFPRVFNNDLPRRGGAGADRIQAIIGDPRNDDNLALAQTHVAFIKFHNKVAEDVKKVNPGKAARDLFGLVREKVTRHYQWIILNDFLPRIIDEATLKDIKRNGPRFFNIAAKGDDRMFMPVEFSAAAYRFGHSMIAPRYDWNPLFRKSFSLDPARIMDLFANTGFSGKLGGSPTLSSKWVIDWRRFFDFEGLIPQDKIVPINKAGIGATFGFKLEDVASYPHNVEDVRLRPLMVRNLIRGYFLKLPSGQKVAEKFLQGGAPKFDPLTEEELLREPEPLADAIRQGGFHIETPLWFYVLKEAELRGGGARLGPVGGRIVAETIASIIKKSRFSIKDLKWTPEYGDRKPEFFMTDLLKFADVINPIG